MTANVTTSNLAEPALAAPAPTRRIVCKWLKRQLQSVATIHAHLPTTTNATKFSMAAKAFVTRAPIPTIAVPTLPRPLRAAWATPANMPMTENATKRVMAVVITAKQGLTRQTAVNSRPGLMTTAAHGPMTGPVMKCATAAKDNALMDPMPPIAICSAPHQKPSNASSRWCPQTCAASWVTIPASILRTANVTT